MCVRRQHGAGVIPIDRLTDVRAPAEVIAQRIPRAVLEATYTMQLPRADRPTRSVACTLKQLNLSYIPGPLLIAASFRCVMSTGCA